MVGRQSKRGPVFSWADEVEKEEEEEEAVAGAGGGEGQAQVQQQQKPNPFGSARPREVVLQEKGIDWRKLDLHLQQPSLTRHESWNGKLQKQNKSQVITTILNRKQPNPAPSRCRKQNLQDTKLRFRGSPVSSQVISAAQVPSPGLFVPPLRYPPKYVAGIPCKPWVPNSVSALDSGYQHFKHEKENVSHQGRKAHNSNSESEMGGNRRSTTTGLVQAKEAEQNGGASGESVVYGDKPEADSATRKVKFHGRNSLGLPLVNIEPPEVQYARIPANARQHINKRDGLNRDGTSFQVTENNNAMKNRWQKITRKVQDLPVKQVDNWGIYAAHRKIKVDRPGSGKNNKNNFENEKTDQLKNLEFEQCAY